MCTNGQVKYQVGEGCEIDQVLAQLHAGLYGLGDEANPCRVFGLENEAGTLMCAWPEGAVRPAIPTGDTPDIMFSAIEGFAETANRGLLRDLGPIIDADPTAKAVLDELDPNLLDGMRTRSTGQLNFFPTEWNNIVVYYNKDMFDKAGVAYPADDWSWADFRETAKKLTTSD